MHYGVCVCVGGGGGGEGGKSVGGGGVNRKDPSFVLMKRILKNNKNKTQNEATFTVHAACLPRKAFYDFA